MADSSRGLVRRVGPLSVDIPRSVGYFGGVALAVGAGLIEAPLGVFIVTVPFLQMLNRPAAPRPARMVGELLEGMSKPVGGDGEGTIRVADPKSLPSPARRVVSSSGQRASGGRRASARRDVSANGRRKSARPTTGR